MRLQLISELLKGLMLSYLKRVPSTSMLPGDSGRCCAVWLSVSGSEGAVGAVESERTSDVPFVESEPGEGASAVPSPSVIVFPRLSLSILAGRRIIEDNPRLFRLPGCSPVGVDGRDRTEPENKPLFGREEVVGKAVLLVWALLLLFPLLLGADPVSIVFTTPWTTTNVPGGGKWRGAGCDWSNGG
jgi:hypothetical protein